jgi:hypothetical protein
MLGCDLGMLTPGCTGPQTPCNGPIPPAAMVGGQQWLERRETRFERYMYVDYKMKTSSDSGCSR